MERDNKRINVGGFNITERLLVRRNGYPIMFASESIQYIEIGKKKDPQQYTPNGKIHRSKCRKLRRS